MVSKTFIENKEVAKKGGNIAKAARLKLEDTTGKKVVTNLNAKHLDKKELKNE